MRLLGIVKTFRVLIHVLISNTQLMQLSLVASV